MDSTVDAAYAASEVDTFVSAHVAAVADHLRNEGRSRLARLVRALPQDAAVLAKAAFDDLPIARHAYALAQASVASQAAKTDQWLRSVRAADIALAILGLPLAKCLLDFLQIVQNIARLLHVPLTGLDDLAEGQLAQSVLQYPIVVHREKYASCDTCENLPLHVFKHSYFDRDVPVVIRAGAADWPAARKWKTPSYLDALCGFREVPVEFSPPGSDTAPREATVSLQKVLETMYGNDNASAGSMYLAQHPLLEYIPDLAKDIITPKLVAAGGANRAQLVNVWMGSSNSGTRLHYDSADNFLVQVVGWKRVVLFAPEQTQHLHCNFESTNFSPVDVDQPDAATHPRFLHAEGHIALLGPGDMLYIPATYWHWVRAVTPSISVNFWF